MSEVNNIVRIADALERIATCLEAQSKGTSSAIPTRKASAPAKPRKRGRTLADMIPADVKPEDVSRAVDVARGAGFVVADERTRRAA